MQQRARKLAVVRSEHTLIVGVDIAKRKHWASIMDGRTELPVGKAFPFDNTRDGFHRLLAQIAQAQEQTGASRVVVGMEPSGHYWKALAWFLKESGLTVVTVNPAHVKRAKEFDDNSPTKNDRKDAWLIARRVNDADFFEAYLPEGIYAELRGLTQNRQQQRTKLNVALNQLHGLLDEYFPEYEDVFADLLGRTSLYVLEHRPFPDDVLAISEADLTAALKAASNSRVGLKRARALQEAARRSIGVKSGMESARLRLRQFLNEVTFWQTCLTETEKALAEALQETGLAPYLLSVPGVGYVTAASFLGEVGDLSRYEDWRQLRKLAGFNLTEESSGQHQSRTRISKRGRPGLRQLLYMMALALVSKNREFRALYAYFRTRPQNPLQSKQALVAVISKLLRLLFTLAHKKRLYDPDKAMGAWRAEQLGLAA